MAKSTEVYAEEEQERIDAVDRYLKGERRSKICKSLGRSRMWLRKWIRRYNDSDKIHGKGWFRDESRAPKNVHRKTDLEVEQLIIKVRKSLMGERQQTRSIGASEPSRYNFICTSLVTQRTRCQACQQSNASSKETVW